MTNGTDPALRAKHTWVEDFLRTTVFDVVVGGYDRDQVDVYLEYIQPRIAEYQNDIAELEQQLERLQQLLRECAEPSYAGLGRRARLLLQFAEEEAGAIIAAADQEAEAIRAAANRYAERIQADLDRQRTELNATLARLHAVLTEIPSIDPDRAPMITGSPDRQVRA
ncbi:MAG: hypothetical protein GEV07_21760 [Streptosporangiales bacterium]|nr:hypothetical protein [Streptosporangiales bacterium]